MLHGVGECLIELSIEFRVPTARPLGQSPTVPVEYKVQWVSDWMFLGREK